MFAFSRYKGPNQFGRAYQIMLERDAHAQGSVDRAIVEHMIRLAPETAAYLYDRYTEIAIKYKKGSRPELEQRVKKAITNCDSEEGRLTGICRFCADLGKSAVQDLDEMRLGGTEEEIIGRGSDWCTDVGRVGCALCQVAGFPARLVFLFDTSRAYSGHAIIEVCRSRIWGAMDPTTNVVYRRPDGKPATTWDLMREPCLIESHGRGNSTPYTTAAQFRGAAISNYFVWESEKYDYTVSRVNDYCRSILDMSMKGWPGGLRWIHGEDVAPQSS